MMLAATRQKHQVLLCEIQISHPHTAGSTIKTNAKLLAMWVEVNG